MTSSGALVMIRADLFDGMSRREFNVSWLRVEE